jgi:hypothetical protein
MIFCSSYGKFVVYIVFVFGLLSSIINGNIIGAVRKMIK